MLVDWVDHSGSVCRIGEPQDWANSGKGQLPDTLARSCAAAKTCDFAIILHPDRDGATVYFFAHGKTRQKTLKPESHEGSLYRYGRAYDKGQ